jgi:hypothetical protein
MKLAVSTALLILLLGTTASVYAQEKGQDDHSEAKPAESHAAPAQQRQAKPAAAKQPQAKPEAKQQTKTAKSAPPQHTQQAAKPARAQAKAAPQQGTQQARASRPATGNGGGSHGRISDAHYASSFGSGHNFHVNQGEYNSRRFSYGGYSFGFLDPWPVGWGYSDDVYVVYVDGGYYMCDVVHPGVRLSISIL